MTASAPTTRPASTTGDKMNLEANLYYFNEQVQGPLQGSGHKLWSQRQLQGETIFSVTLTVTVDVIKYLSQVVNHASVCSCPEGYQGDPLTSCTASRSRNRNNYYY